MNLRVIETIKAVCTPHMLVVYTLPSSPRLRSPIGIFISRLSVSQKNPFSVSLRLLFFPFLSCCIRDGDGDGDY